MQTRFARRGAKGQSTVELMLMIPIIFAIFFFVIEMSLYFSAIHYANYGTYVVARSKIAGYGQGWGNARSAQDIAELVLTGSVFKGNFMVSDHSTGVTINMQSWVTNFPYLASLLPNMKFQTSIYLGPDESGYETISKPACTDNDINSNPCG